MRAGRLVTPDDNVVSMPRARLWTQPVNNANDGSPRLHCTAHFHLHPAHDADAVRYRSADVVQTSLCLHADDPIVVVVEDGPWTTHDRLKA